MVSESPQLLLTKVRVPRHAPGVIGRPRLADLVTELKARKLTVVTAGPGFGKTSLAAAWAERLRSDGCSVGWLALDPDDDEPGRFLFYLCHALHRACGIGSVAIELICSVSLVSSRAVLATLINELTEADDEVILVLDDYYVIARDEIHEDLAFLVRNAPSQLHLVVTSRDAVPLSLAGLRAQNQLLEVDAVALRFSLGEMKQLIEQDRLGTLEPSELAMLHEKTGGWPAMLRIVAATSAQLKDGLRGYVRRLSGEMRVVGDYLAEMLAGLPFAMVQFMLRTSLLDPLTAELCEAVTGVKASQELLETIARRQMLLTPIDHERRAYRYHPLLAEYLQQRLRSQVEDEIPWLHRHAYWWYADHGLWTDAVQHAIAAGDNEQAVRWIEICAMELVKRGDLLTLLGWVRLFPTELMRGQIRVRLAIVWGLALAIRLEEATELVAGIEQDIAAEILEAAALRCECRAIRAVILALQDDSAGALPIARSCFTEASDPWTANVATNVARFSYWKAGDLVSFYAVPWTPYPPEGRQRDIFATVYRHCLQGLAEMQQLRLQVAACCYQDAVSLAEREVGPYSPTVALPLSLLAEVRYEEGRLEEAEALVIGRVPIVEAAGMLDCVLRARLVLARSAAWRANFGQAYRELESAEELGQLRRWDRLVAAALLERLRLNLEEGRLAEARASLRRLEHLAQKRPASSQCAWSDIHLFADLGRAEIAAEEHPSRAAGMLRLVHQQLVAADDRYLALHVAARLAVVLLAADETVPAATAFDDVLQQASTCGAMQAVLDGGREIRSLLSKHWPAEAAPGDLEHLIERWRARYEFRRHDAKVVPASADVLSPRERDVLELISQGQSNKDIARVLEISPETVKTHVKSIFLKFGVDRRIQAIRRAQSLGLISEHERAVTSSRVAVHQSRSWQ